LTVLSNDFFGADRSLEWSAPVICRDMESARTASSRQNVLARARNHHTITAPFDTFHVFTIGLGQKLGLGSR
jgi:hypothetical protein